MIMVHLISLDLKITNKHTFNSHLLMTHTVQLRKFSAMIEAIVHSLVFKKDCEAKIEFLSLNLILNKFCEMNKTPVLPVKTGLWPQPPSLLHSGVTGRYATASRCAPLMLPVTTAILSIKICSERIIRIIVQYTAFLIYIIVIHIKKIC